MKNTYAIYAFTADHQVVTDKYKVDSKEIAEKVFQLLHPNTSILTCFPIQTGKNWQKKIEFFSEFEFTFSPFPLLYNIN